MIHRLKTLFCRKEKVYIPYPVFVWMRQVNERLASITERMDKLEAGQGEQSVNERAEFAASVEANSQRLDARLSKIEEFLQKA